jgi:hypothetical protein
MARDVCGEVAIFGIAEVVEPLQGAGPLAGREDQDWTVAAVAAYLHLVAFACIMLKNVAQLLGRVEAANSTETHHQPC